MALTFTAPFAQTIQTASAVTTLASVITTDTPTNTELIATAGSDGAFVSKLTAQPRATVTATALYLFIEKSADSDTRLIDSVLMEAHTFAATTAVPRTAFTNISEVLPIRLEAGDKLYISAGVALASGIVFNIEWTDF